MDVHKHSIRIMAPGIPIIVLGLFAWVFVRRRPCAVATSASSAKRLGARSCILRMLVCGALPPPRFRGPTAPRLESLPVQLSV